MVKLKLSYFAHIERRQDALEMTMMLGKVEGSKKRGRLNTGWIESPKETAGLSLQKLSRLDEDRRVIGSLLAMKDKAKLQLMKLDVGDRFSHLPLPKASILIPLMIKNEKLSALFTVRSMKLRRSPGEVCFPGGRSEPTDKDEVTTALREAEEEIGLRPEQAEVICRLVPIIDKTGSLITAVVAWIEDTFQAHPNPEEVSDVFSVPLEYFINPSKHKAITFKKSEKYSYTIHWFDYDDPENKATFTIWGLTAKFVMYVALAIFGEKPTYKINFDPDNLKSSAENILMEDLNMIRSKL